MTNLLNIFDAVFVINLDHRPDRLHKFVQSLGLSKEEIEKTIRRWSATHVPSDGAKGCILSHLAIVKEAKNKGYKKILVFEDDAVPFSADPEKISKIASDIENEKWDVYYLGYNSHERLHLASSHSLSAKEIFSTHAIAYSSDFFDTFIQGYERGDIKILDVWLRYQVQPHFRCLASYPLLFTQSSGYSDIERKEISYDFIVKRYLDNTSHISQPAISVCIPTYEMKGRGADFLSHSFKSLKQQSFKDFEVIVSDHSIDDSIAKVCERWKSELIIRYYRDSSRGNSSANINNAIRKAEGKIIKILFQDDFLCSTEALKKIYDIHRQGSVWCASACYHTSDGIKLERPFFPRYHEKIHLGENTISSPSVISFVKDRGCFFDENLIWLMDCDFYRSMRDKNGLPSLLMEHLVVNRLWEDNYTNQIENTRKDSELKYLKKKYGE